MKIAINCAYFVPKGGGIKEYIFNLVTNIKKLDNDNEYIFYVFKDTLDYWNKYMNKDFTVKIIPFNRKDRIKIALFSHFFWYKEVKKEGIQIFHSPFFHLPFYINAKKVVTVHDLRFMKYPKSYGKLRYYYLKFSVPNSIKKADKIIAISASTKADLIKYFGIPQNYINVIHESIDRNRFKKNIVDPIQQEIILKQFSLDEIEYVLSVGHVEPRKNYDLLLEVFTNLKKQNKIKSKLVIIGQTHSATQYFKDTVKNNDDILYLDYVDEDVLLTIYQNSKLFIFPSYYEGFGFPPLEAAAFEVPTIASNVTSIPEICGKGALYFNPFSMEEMSAKLELVLNDIDTYNQLKVNAIKNLQNFSWEKNAKETIKIYNNLT